MTRWKDSDEVAQCKRGCPDDGLLMYEKVEDSVIRFLCCRCDCAKGEIAVPKRLPSVWHIESKGYKIHQIVQDVPFWFANPNKKRRWVEMRGRHGKRCPNCGFQKYWALVKMGSHVRRCLKFKGRKEKVKAMDFRSLIPGGKWGSVRSARSVNQGPGKDIAGNAMPIKWGDGDPKGLLF